MSDKLNPLAAHHLPPFITPPGQTDWLLVVMGVVLVALIMFVGLLYFKLHALPEQRLHGTNNKAQFEIVAVLALLALFTHNGLFWVAALMLAMIPIPDLVTPLYGMAASLKKIAAGKASDDVETPLADAPDLPAETAATPREAEV